MGRKEARKNNDLQNKETRLPHDTYTLLTAIYKKSSELISANISPIFLFIAAIWTLQSPVVLPQWDLDPSWVNALNMAILDHLQFGKDIAFTYGPLGFLVKPLVMDYNLWRISLVFNLCVHFLFFACIYRLLSRLSAKWYHYLLMAFVLVFVNSTLDEILPVIVSIIIFTALINEKSDRKEYIYLTIAAFLTAVAALYKFNALIECVSVLAIALVAFYFVKKDIKYGVYTAVCSLAFFVILWLLCGQCLSNISGYITDGLEISNGYSAAMSLDGPQSQIYVGVVAVIVTLLLFAYSVIKKKTKLILLLLLNSIVLFSSFKHGFVRQDNHILNFLQVYALIFGIILTMLLIESNKETMNSLGIIPIVNIAAVLLILLAYILMVSPSAVTNGIVTQYSTYQSAGHMLIDRSAFDFQVQNQTKNVKVSYPCDISVLDYIGNKTVDIVPWDISLSWAYGLNWSPRLVFQSYSDYTQTLDRKTSEHFAGNNSPRLIIYSLKTIDNRYPAFDEPATFREMLLNYQTVEENHNFILLNRTGSKENIQRVDLGTAEVKMGDNISIPRYDGFVFGELYVNYSAYGKIMNILYKPSPVFIKVGPGDGPIYGYKLVPDTARDGIFLSEYVTGVNVGRIFNGVVAQDINDITVYTNDPLEYSNSYDIHFYGIPINDTNKNISSFS